MATPNLPVPAASLPPAQPSAEAWETFAGLPCRLRMEIPVPGFTVGQMLALTAEMVIKTGCPRSGEVPINVNGARVAWAEFETVGGTVAARITRLA